MARLTTDPTELAHIARFFPAGAGLRVRIHHQGEIVEGRVTNTSTDHRSTEHGEFGWSASFTIELDDGTKGTFDILDVSELEELSRPAHFWGT